MHLGPLTTPDRVAQIADILMTHEKMTWSMVTGRYQGRLHVSLRTSDPGGEAGRVFRQLAAGLTGAWRAWRFALLMPAGEAPERLGLRGVRVIQLRNGGLPVRLWLGGPGS